MTGYIVPVAMACIIAHGLAKGVNIFQAMTDGVKKGLEVCKGIFPAMLVMLTAIAMLRASGALDLLGRLMAPVLEIFGIPPDCLPLALLRPFSGSGALSIGSEVMKTSGPDSLAGRVAAVMLGSSETSFYIIGLYSAYLKLKDTRYALPAALAADIAAFVMSGITVRLFFG